MRSTLYYIYRAVVCMTQVALLSPKAFNAHYWQRRSMYPGEYKDGLVKHVLFPVCAVFPSLKHTALLFTKSWHSGARWHPNRSRCLFDVKHLTEENYGTLTEHGYHAPNITHGQWICKMIVWNVWQFNTVCLLCSGRKITVLWAEDDFSGISTSIGAIKTRTIRCSLGPGLHCKKRISVEIFWLNKGQ